MRDLWAWTWSQRCHGPVISLIWFVLCVPVLFLSRRLPPHLVCISVVRSLVSPHRSAHLCRSASLHLRLIPSLVWFVFQSSRLLRLGPTSLLSAWRERVWPLMQRLIKQSRVNRCINLVKRMHMQFVRAYTQFKSLKFQAQSGVKGGFVRDYTLQCINTHLVLMWGRWDWVR